MSDAEKAFREELLQSGFVMAGPEERLEIAVRLFSSHVSASEEALSQARARIEELEASNASLWACLHDKDQELKVSDAHLGAAEREAADLKTQRDNAWRTVESAKDEVIAGLKAENERLQGLRVPCKTCGGADTAKAESAQCYNCRNKPHWELADLQEKLAALEKERDAAYEWERLKGNEIQVIRTRCEKAEKALLLADRVVFVAKCWAHAGMGRADHPLRAGCTCNRCETAYACEKFEAARAALSSSPGETPEQECCQLAARVKPCPVHGARGRD